MNQFGWFFFGFGMIFFWLFVCRADLTSWYRFGGRLETAPGRVAGSSDTGATAGGSKHHRGTPIYKNKFSFLVDDREYHGASYATGYKLPAGSAVTVEYAPGQPRLARIQGMRTNVFGPGVLFVLIFPLIGLGIISFGLASGVRACRLLAHGVPTSAKLLFKEPTNMSVNRRTVYKYAFVFKTLAGEVCTATAKTATDRFANDAEEHILYDLRQPQRALLLDGLPGAPLIGEDGHLVSRRPALALWSSIIPLATILGHGWWALRLLSHSAP
jgi:hypothetical protein